MKIGFLNKFNYENKKAGVNFSNPFNLKMKSALKQDTFSFTGIKRTFKTRKDAEEYYNAIAKQANGYLEDGDDVSALETLGYTVSLNPNNNEITIDGDYIPVPMCVIRNTLGKDLASFDYKKLKINEKTLLRNVANIKGSYPDYVEEMLIEKEIKKARLVKEALANKEYKKALNILGFKTSSYGKSITIEGDYTPVRINHNERQRNLSYFGISEKELLSNVTRINGRALFEKADSIDHYIEVEKLYSKTSNFMYDLRRENSEAVKRLARLEPGFLLKIQIAKELFEKGDNFEALKILDIPVEKDENGKITVNGDFDLAVSNKLARELRLNLFSFEELGLDYENVLKDIVRVKGYLRLPEYALKSLDKDIKVDGILYADPEVQKKLDKMFMTVDDIAREYNLNPAFVRPFVWHRSLKPNLSYGQDAYFSEISGENKKMLDTLTERRDEILTFYELKQKYSAGEIVIRNLMEKGMLVPYGINADEIINCRNLCYLFDIKDEANAEGIKKLEHDLEIKLKTLEKEKAKPYLLPAKIKEACDRNQVKAKGMKASNKKYPASALEALGYGSKEDLIALAPETFNLNFNKYQQYIFNNDRYDITRKEMIELLTISRQKNPAIINIKELQKKLGKDKEEFLKAIYEDKINVITENPLYLTNYSDYCINLFDEKNYEYFKTIDNPEFEEFLSQTYQAYKDYKEHNLQEYQKFLSSEPLTKKEASKVIDKKIEDKQLSTKLKDLQAEQARQDAREDRSLRLVIAWALSPKTKAAQGVLMTDNVKQLLEKYKALNAIRKVLLLNEINMDKASELTDKIALTPEEKVQILIYFKSSWEKSGTEEWKQSLKDAKKYLETYKKQGLDAIDNEDVKAALVRWNARHHKAN